MKVTRKNHPTPLSIARTNTPRWKQMTKIPSRRVPFQAILLVLSFLRLISSGWACCVILLLDCTYYNIYINTSIMIKFPRLYTEITRSSLLLINHEREPGWTRYISECHHRIITTVSNNWRVSISSFLPKPAYDYLYSAPNGERTNKLLETLPSITEKELEKLGHRGNMCYPFMKILPSHFLI